RAAPRPPEALDRAGGPTCPDPAAWPCARAARAAAPGVPRPASPPRYRGGGESAGPTHAPHHSGRSAPARARSSRRTSRNLHGSIRRPIRREVLLVLLALPPPIDQRGEEDRSLVQQNERR